LDRIADAVLRTVIPLPLAVTRTSPFWTLFSTSCGPEAGTAVAAFVGTPAPPEPPGPPPDAADANDGATTLAMTATAATDNLLSQHLMIDFDSLLVVPTG
jgi:hypothetical protein